MLITRDIPNVEILSVGTWQGMGCPLSGCVFTSDDLDGIILATTSDAPVKLGHTDDQKLLQEDGMPAAGWVTNLRRVGDKILADLKAVPRKIADLIDAGAYRSRSVELSVSAGKSYISALALLGADLPAVENLSDITALYAKAHLSLAGETRAVLFTEKPEASFAIPSGMSYDDLSQALRVAFCEASPGADPEDVWVSDLYEGSAIFNLDGRYWQQSYTVNKSGVSVSGTPTEVQRVTEWRAMAMSRASFAAAGEQAITALAQFTTRAKSRAEFRSAEGRTLSQDNRELLARLAASANDAREALETLSAEKPGEPAKTDNHKPALELMQIERERAMAELELGRV